MEFLMSDHSAFQLSSCLGSFEGQCLRRAAELGLFVKRALSARGGKGAGVAKATKRIASHAAARRDLHCCVAQGLTCRHAPIRPTFDGRNLRIGKVRVRQFRRRCKQTRLLDVCQSRGWPLFIEAPFGRPSVIDPENGFRDLVYRLNRRQKQIHFWCDGGGLRWAIVGKGPASQQ